MAICHSRLRRPFVKGLEQLAQLAGMDAYKRIAVRIERLAASENTMAIE